MLLSYRLIFPGTALLSVQPPNLHLDLQYNYKLNGELTHREEICIHLRMECEVPDTDFILDNSIPT